MIRNVERELPVGPARARLHAVAIELNDVLMEVRYVDDLPPVKVK